MIPRIAALHGLVGLAICPALAQSIEPIIVPLGIGSAEPLAISGDGSTIVGYGSREGGRSALSWTSSGLGMMVTGWPTYNSAEAAAVSHDGSIIVGRMDARHPMAPRTGAVRWDAGGMTELGALPGHNASASRGLSGDGSVVMGVSYNLGPTPTDMRTFRWTAAGGMQDIGVLAGTSGTYANSMSADGSTIVGVSLGSGPSQPFRWTATGGMSALQVPAGAYSSWAGSVSGDGSIVVGAVQGGAPGYQATMWDANGVHLLHTLPGVDHSWPNAVTADGSILVGHAVDFSAGYFAALWNAQREMLNLNTYAASIGIDLTGWDLWDATGISADGTRIVGSGLYEVSPGYWREQPWVMTIPAPGATGVLGLALVMGTRRRR